MTAGERRWRLALATLFVAGLLLRVGFAREVGDLPTFHYLVVDAASYDRLARTIAAGEWLPRQPFFMAPLYPYFLAVIYRLAGPSYDAVRAVQLLLSALTPVLVALASSRPFGRRAGFFAGVLGAAYGPLVAFAPLLLKETLTIFLVAAALALLLRYVGRAPDETGGRTRWAFALPLATGLLLGSAAQLRENLLLLLPAACVAAALSREHRWWKGAALVATGGLVALLPIAWLNGRVGGPAVQTSNQSGMNIYIGNVLSHDGTYQPLSAGSQHPEAMREDTRRLAAGLLAVRTGRPVDAARLSDGAASRILWRETWRHIAAAPGRWLHLMMRKTRLFWSNYEIPDAEGYVVFRQLSALLGLAAVSFGLLAPLAAIGLLPAWRRDRRVTVALLLLTAATFASVVGFFVLGRYRLPVVLFLLPLAGCGTSWLVDLARARRWRRLALAGLALLLLVWAAHIPPFPPATRGQHEAALWFNLGQAGDRWTGDLLAGAAASPSAASRRQRALDGAARAEAATAFLTEALRRDPTFFTARIERAVALHRWGSCLLLAGDPRLASQRYAVALAELDAAQHAVPAWAGPDLRAQMLSLQRAAQRNLTAAQRAATPSPP